MSDPLAPIRWIIGGRRVIARSVLPTETITTVWRAFSNAPFEPEDRSRVYQASGWASKKAGAMKIVRKGVSPFGPVLNARWRPHAQGSEVVFTEGLLLNSWGLLVFYLGCVAVVLLTSGGQIEGSVRFGMLAGAAMFLLNRWIARNDFDLMLETMITKVGALTTDEWPLEVARPQIVEPARGFGRRGL